MPVLARLGLPLLVHAESPEALAAAAGAVPAGDPRRYATWLGSRPAAVEVEAIRLVLALAAGTGCRVHIVHLSAAEALADLRAARARGVSVSVETCPHYLAFAAEQIGDGATAYKCAPPIRARANRERLWDALRAGDIDLVATDHSPCPPALKDQGSGDYMAAWGGIASLQLAGSVLWSGASERGFTPADLARWMAGHPARLAGLAGRKGAIVPGADADLALWDLDTQWTVAGARLYHRHPLTPYEGMTLRGLVRSTFVRGVRVFERGGAGRESDRFPAAPTGRLLAPAGIAGREGRDRDVRAIGGADAGPVDRARGSG
jgi:allantoinase